MSDDKLKDLLRSMGSKLLGDDDDLTERKRIVSNGSQSNASNASSDGSVIVHKKFDQKLKDIQDEYEEDDEEQEQEQPLRIKTKAIIDEEDEEDDFNDYVIDSPLPPPKDLDPGKLYALYEFSGDDPSHCELDPDDAVILLNDQDSYWWLVKKEFDGKIGFAPAECLETYHERLARLNCWKNENLEKNSKSSLEFSSSSLNFNKNNSLNVSKSVSFSEDVLITDENYNKNEETDNEREEDYEDLYEEEQESNYDDYDDDYDFINNKKNTNDLNENSKNYLDTPSTERDEFASVSDNFPITPLTINKKPKPIKQQQQRPLSGSDFDDSPLVAPTAFFSVNNNTSGSIGTYSPSSSEFDSPGNTPPLQNFKKPLRNQILEDFEKKGNIPQSKGTTDMFQSIRMLDVLMNDELTSSEDLQSNPRNLSQNDTTLTFDDNDDDKLSSPISLDEEKKNLSNITNSTFVNSNTSLHITSSNTSIDNYENEDFDYDDDSTQKDLSFQSDETSSKNKRFSTHPEIEDIFKDSLTKMDELAEKLRLLNEQFN
ncbi:Bud site selection protein [Wickerhamomyces ciferrii]|uniref:Bud site selection protein n=1 Tax=Wickerhamomyces ciferrii (strain ATCC 14091 / BCRC 22168 / CBS 111 / JCM 3599 / NBRC 0793 / NRRL Y-1031 F-60-10) TaxID=1206466 RepID=K0KSZ3_WICCF|nr:Bud site selection protein [Wickerhamomyces ciferrii]CCH44448.1 Bud site selection protein [Wickerhamomyces ciferrii]